MPLSAAVAPVSRGSRCHVMRYAHGRAGATLSVGAGGVMPQRGVVARA